jgi:signal transduction histidine kinase
MVVDDAPSNLQLLVTLMQMEGYKVRPVRSGAAALALLQEVRPDVILLDVNMPGMDGFEVCRRLKSDPLNCDIPVLFVSALSDTNDKVKAFEAGGTDYITKPFQMKEVRMRIETHLHMARMKAELEAANRKLRDSERLREMLAHLVAHDMRTPLFGILGMAELVAEKEAVLHDAESTEYVTTIRDSARLLVDLISDMLDVYKHDCGTSLAQLENVLFDAIIRDSLGLLGGLARRHPFKRKLPAEPILLRCDRSLTTRALVNLMSNAIRFTKPGTPVTLTAEVEPGFLKIGVTDEGEGIAEEHQSRLFQKFGQLEARDKGVRYSSGLGLVFCRMVAEAQGGKIGVVSSPGNGATFWLTIPLA